MPHYQIVGVREMKSDYELITCAYIYEFCVIQNFKFTHCILCMAYDDDTTTKWYGVNRQHK